MSIELRALSLAMAFLSGTSLACECTPEKYDEKMERADRIFVGTVISGKFSGGVVTYRFQVSDVFKGKVSDQDKFTEQVGHSCAMDLAVGREYVIFVQRDGGIWKCSGTGQKRRLEQEGNYEKLRQYKGS
jgi:hypothetical protein